MIEHIGRAKADRQIANTDHRSLLAIGYIPIAAKNMAKNPSSTMTRKIDLTTDDVVFDPSEAGAALDFEAFDASDQADHQCHERRLDHADGNVVTDIASRKRARKTSGGMPS